MDLNKLRELGAFAGDDLVEKEIEWTQIVDGEEKRHKAKFWIKGASHEILGEVIEEGLAALGEGAEVNSRSAYIAAFVRNEKGERIFSYSDASQLTPLIAASLYAAAVEQFAGMRDPKKPSRPKKSSGVS